MLRREPTRTARAALIALVAAWALAGCAMVNDYNHKHPQAQARRGQMPPVVTVKPSLVVIAGTPVSYVENWPDDVFFYQGRYYRPYQGSWYSSASVSSGWTQITAAQVPKVVVQVPSDYRKRKVVPKGKS